MTEKHNNTFKRRTSDHGENTGKSSQEAIINMIYEDLQSIKELNISQSKTLENMKEILIVWDNTKGFVSTIKLISRFVFWLSTLGGAITALWYLLTNNKG